MKVSKKLILLPIAMLALTGCGDKDKKETELPDAPVKKMSLALANFRFDENHPKPTITGFKEKGSTITYTYLNSETSAKIGNYVVGEQGTINVGSYKLKADVKSKEYKPFSLTTTFSVTNGIMSNVVYEAYDFAYDEVLPEPLVENMPSGSEVAFAYYQDPEEKHEYVAGAANTLDVGEYVLEATMSCENYETTTVTCAFEVLSAQFDEAYAMKVSEIDLGEVDGSFDFSGVALNDLLGIKVVASNEDLEGVTFSWKNTPVITSQSPDTPFDATVIAHKTGFTDKEYDISVSFTKKRVNMPALFDGESGVVPIDYLEYTGEEIKVHLSGVTSYVEVSGDAMTQTNAGTYTVTAALKDKTYTCWSDGSTSDKTFTWEIHKYNPAGHSSGYRISIGNYICASHDTTPRLNTSLVDDPVDLGYQFKLYNSVSKQHEWTDYEAATFEVTSSNAEINAGGKLVVNDASSSVSLHVGTSNPNHEFSQNYELSFEENVIRFKPGNVVGSDGVTKLKNSFWQDVTSTSDDYVMRCALNGSGFAVSTMFKQATSVKIKYDISEVTGSWPHSTYVWFSKNTSFGDSTGDINRTIVLHEDDYDFENEYVQYNFNISDFDGEDYYLQFWIGGSSGGYLRITEIIISLS